MLMRFWNYDRDADAFTSRSEGPVGALLLQWNPLPGNGVECWTTPLTLDPALALDNVVFVEGEVLGFWWIARSVSCPGTQRNRHRV